MIGIIIQARTGSTRFPKKVIKKIYENKNILDLIIENLKTLNKKIVLATTSKKKDSIITQIAKKHSIDFFCGEENNVLKRYIRAAEKFGISKIIRVTGDNIFIQPDLIKPLIDLEKTNIEYATYRINNKNVILTHWGLFSEYVTLDALKKVFEKTKSQKYLEHVTYYIYTHPGNFNIKYFEVPKILNRTDIRLTIDIKEDFEICKKIVHNLEKNKLDWNYEKILNFVLKNPDILLQMRSNIRSQEKK